jgi:heme/copper-type cytochrome/quinol oxidase subunit 3
MAQKSSGAKPATPAKGSMKAKRGRYTAPTPKTVKHSPFWVPVVMTTSLVLGLLVLVSNYLNMLPGDAQNRYLLLGLGLVTGGFFMASTYH